MKSCSLKERKVKIRSNITKCYTEVVIEFFDEVLDKLVPSVYLRTLNGNIYDVNKHEIILL